MINIIKQNDDTAAYVKEFVADTEEDIKDLPTKLNEVYPGSTCIIVSTSEVYMLNNKMEWIKL